MNMKSKSIVLAVIVVAVILAIVSVSPAAAPAQKGLPNSSLIFSLTDPPQVPSGTNSLIVSYSSVQAHVTSSGGYGAWINGAGGGTLDLMALVNSSQVIARASIPANASVNMLRFYISSAHIVVNGTTYNVTVPNGEITATLTQNAMINGSALALIDLSPTVATIVTQNSTIFVLVPSVKAIIVPASPETNATSQVGSTSGLNQTRRTELENSKPNLTMTGLSLGTSNNITTFSMTVKNNANTSVQIKHVMIFGNISVSVMPIVKSNFSENPSEGAQHNSSDMSNESNASASSHLGVNESISNHSSNRPTSNVSASNNRPDRSGADISGNRGSDNSNASESANISAELGNDRGIHVVMSVGANRTANASINSDIHDLVDVGVSVESFRTTTFVVASNGTLVLPESEQDFEGNGYALAPGASHVFNFTGTILFGERHISEVLVHGGNYRVVVKGEEGASVSANATAT